MSTPRVSPGNFSELGLVNWLLSKLAARVVGVRDVHLFSTLGRQRGLFRAWLFFSSRLMPGGTLSRRDTELVILRVAQLRDCRYEYEHHVRIGRRFGIGALELAQLAESPSSPYWPPAQRALLSAVAALVQTRDIDDATWLSLEPHYTPRQLIELCLLVGQYDGLATTIRALRIQPDRR